MEGSPGWMEGSLGWIEGSLRRMEGSDHLGGWKDHLEMDGNHILAGNSSRARLHRGKKSGIPPKVLTQPAGVTQPIHSFKKFTKFF